MEAGDDDGLLCVNASSSATPAAGPRAWRLWKRVLQSLLPIEDIVIYPAAGLLAFLPSTGHRGGPGQPLRSGQSSGMTHRIEP